MSNRVFTGLKPTGQLTLGNYLGAIRPLTQLATAPDNDLLVMVMDDPESSLKGASHGQGYGTVVVRRRYTEPR